MTGFTFPKHVASAAHFPTKQPPNYLLVGTVDEIVNEKRALAKQVPQA
jgi:hypothetical protein